VNAIYNGFYQAAAPGWFFGCYKMKANLLTIFEIIQISINYF